MAENRDLTSARSYLGAGWAFPMRTDGRGRIALVSEEDALARAIFLILSTVKGQRRMRPNFGCGIHQFVFAPNNSTTIDLIQHEVIEALNWWEPRITVLDVNAHPDPDDEQITLRTSISEITGMPHMQNIKTTIGEDSFWRPTRRHFASGFELF